MAVIESVGGLVDVVPGWSPGAYSAGAMQLYDRYWYDYATLYELQPNVRTCVDFLARNIAQLGLHVFRRISDTDRQRLREHGLARTIERPLPPEFKVTRYRLIEWLVSDLGIYWNAFWIKLRAGGRVGLLQIPPPYVTVYGGLVPTRYEVRLGGNRWTFPPDQIVHFRGYNPSSSIVGLSPLETLRRILAEEQAMGDYREYFWQNAARMSGIIERPLEAPEWSTAAQERFKAEWAEFYAGTVNSGRTPILQDGMKFKEASFDAQQSEYLGSRRLTREECARAYHIPLPLVGILDHATFSNIKEQHKHLYQDCLGPWLAMIEQEIELQLLPEFEDSEGVYCEFNIAEKLQGSFEEQTQSFQAAVGRPYMTADEARARLNLPSMGGDAARLVTPLNVLVGGQASPRDSVPPKAVQASLAKAARLDPTRMELRERHMEKWTEVLAAYFRRQEAAITSRVPKARKVAIDDVWHDGERWDRELEADVLKLNLATATVWARWVADQLQAQVDVDAMLPYLQEHSRIQATNINRATRDAVLAALAEAGALEAVRHVFEVAASARAPEIAASAVTSAANFGSHEGARHGGMRTKIWVVNSANPRPEHATMDGETVGIDEVFSNGMRWPGDPAGGAENNANCKCSVAFGR